MKRNSVIFLLIGLLIGFSIGAFSSGPYTLYISGNKYIIRLNRWTGKTLSLSQGRYSRYEWEKAKVRE